MTQNIKNSIIQILDEQGTIQGTGFIIDDSTAVTCAHVVAAAGIEPGNNVSITFAGNGETGTSQVLTEFWRPPEYDDVAILRLQNPLPATVTPLMLGASLTTGSHTFNAFGYPMVGDIQGVWAHGIILGPITNGNGTAMLQIRAQEIIEGMSGAPVLDTHTDRVVGMVTATYYHPNANGKLRDVAFATPIEAILGAYPHAKLTATEAAAKPVINQALPVPAHFVPRPEITGPLTQNLLASETCTPGMVNASALLGLGGIGKSTIAAAVAYTPEVQRRFSDGILWATVGQTPDLLTQLTYWIQTLGDYDIRPNSIETAAAHLKSLLQHKAILLILDDVWEARHLQALQVCGQRSHLIITTRRFDVAEEAGAKIFQLEVMSPAQTLQLLATRMGRPIHDEERRDALRLAEAVGFLPLALELAAARVARGTPWSALRHALEDEVAQLEALEAPRRRRREQSQVEASFHLSLKALQADDEETRQAFIWLGILPEDAPISAPMAATIWQITEAKAADTLELLWNDALLLPGPTIWIGNRQWPSYRLHDLLRDIARRLLTTPSPNGLGWSLPAVHATLIERYRQRSQNGQWHTLPHDGYIHANLVWHLEQAGQVDQIHALLNEETATGRNGWYQIKEQLGQTAGYLADVTQAERLLHQQNLPPSKIIGMQIRYALMLASLNSLARNLPLTMLIALVEKKLWSPAQGLAYACQLLNPEQQARALIELSVYQSPGAREITVQKAIQVATEISDAWLQTETLIDLAQRLAELNQPVNALSTAREIVSDRWQAEVLTRLIPHTPHHLLEQILAAARNIQDEEYRVEVLSELAPRLPHAARIEVLQEALTAAQTMDDEERQADLLAKLAPHLPQDLLLQALSLAQAIEWEGAKAELLADLAHYLPEPFCQQTLAEALVVAKKIQFDELRGQILVKMAPHLPEKLITKAVANAWLIKSSKTRAKTLAQLAPYLPNDTKEKANHEILTVVENTQNYVQQVMVVLALAPYLPPEPKNRVLYTALKSLKMIPQHWKRVELLGMLVPHLSLQLLSDAQEITKNIQDSEGHGTTLSLIAVRMAECHNLTGAVTIARTIPNKWLRAKALTALAPYLSEETRRVTINEAKEIALTIDNAVERAAALTGLAPQLAQMGCHAAALEAIQNIWYEQWQVRALATVAPLLPEDQLIEALKLAQTIRDSAHRSEALVGLAPHLAEPLLLNALRSVQSIHDEQRRAEITLGLIPHLPEPLKFKALRGLVAAIRLTWDSPKQLQMLANLAPQLPAAVRAEILQQMHEAIWQITDNKELAQTITQLAPYLPAALHPQALKTMQEMPDEAARVEALLGLAPYFMPAQIAQVFNLISAINSEAQRGKALEGLAPYLTAAQFEAALELVQSFQDENQKVSVLAKLTAYAPENLLPAITQLTPCIADQWRQSEVLVELALRLAQFGHAEKAFSTAKSIWDEVKRAIVLAQLYPYLPAPLNTETVSEALANYHNIWYTKWRAKVLVELAPHLPEEDRLPLLRELLTAIAAMSDERKRGDALAQVVPVLPKMLLRDALEVTQTIHSQPQRAELLTQLVPLAPASLHAEMLAAIRSILNLNLKTGLLVKQALCLRPPETSQVLKEALSLVWCTENREHIPQLLAEIVPALVTLSRAQLAEFWQDILTHLTQRRRKNLLADLIALEPIIFSLGGADGIAEISHAIQDAGRWWP